MELLNISGATRTIYLVVPHLPCILLAAVVVFALCAKAQEQGLLAQSPSMIGK